MATVKYTKSCDLCGLTVEIKGFTLVTENGLLSFCCAGCQSIYQLLYMNNRAMDIDTKTNNNNEDNY
ncbi:MAG: metal-binding protein [Methyloglobulus sp.]|nr:metal-binding protein [Methyloglobulus sp.]